MKRSSSSRLSRAGAPRRVLGAASPALLAGGLEHRLGLRVVEPLAGEEGGDCSATRSMTAMGLPRTTWGANRLQARPAAARRVKALAGAPAVGAGFPLRVIVENPAIGRPCAVQVQAPDRRRRRHSDQRRGDYHLREGPTTGSRRSACRSPRARPCSAELQRRLVAAQAASYVGPAPVLPGLRPAPAEQGRYPIAFRTPFGDVRLRQPALPSAAAASRRRAKTFSPLTGLFTEHTAPELLYLETSWASLVSYGADGRSARRTSCRSVRRPTPRPSATTCTRSRGAARPSSARSGLLHRRAARPTGKELPHPGGADRRRHRRRLRPQLGRQEEPASRSSSASRCPRIGTTAISACVRPRRPAEAPAVRGAARRRACR